MISILKVFIKQKKYRPILKKCGKQQVDLKSCDTESCQEDNDCYSVKCYNNNCIINKTIYLCSGVGMFNNTVRCAKDAHMKCFNDNECFSSTCKEGFCKNNLPGDLKLIKKYL